MINLQAEKREENPENEHDHGATVGALVDAGVPDLLDDDDGLGACAWNKACVRGARRGEFGVRHGISHAHTVTSWADKHTYTCASNVFVARVLTLRLYYGLNGHGLLT